MQSDIPDKMMWGESLDLNVSPLSALGQCNRAKADIRQAEKKRASHNSGAFYYQQQEKKHVNSKSDVNRWWRALLNK
ncbi:hypothetical protein HMPREF3197_03853 [Klebsiella pneumoniae]|nr:hypothetical protein HMPREF3197_03853 [Klebsiella pneumoniae]